MQEPTFKTFQTWLGTKYWMQQNEKNASNRKQQTKIYVKKFSNSNLTIMQRTGRRTDSQISIRHNLWILPPPQGLFVRNLEHVIRKSLSELQLFFLRHAAEFGFGIGVALDGQFGGGDGADGRLRCCPCGVAR